MITWWITLTTLCLSNQTIKNNHTALIPSQKPENQILIDKIIGKVEKKPIFWSDLKKFRQNLPLKVQLDEQFVSTALGQKALKCAHGEMAAEEITNEELRSYLMDEALIEHQYPASEEAVKKTLLDAFNQKVKNEQDLIPILGEETAKAYLQILKATLSKRSLFERELASKVNVTEEMLKNEFYLKVPPLFHIKTITFFKKSYKSERLAKKTAQEIFKALEKDPTEFGKLARSYSEDAAKEDEGDVGSFFLKDLITHFQKYVTQMQVGEMRLITLPEKYIILKLEKIGLDQQKFEEMKNELHVQVMTKIYNQQLNIWLAQQKEKVLVEFNALPEG